jgi:hypothetical protein
MKPSTSSLKNMAGGLYWKGLLERIRDMLGARSFRSAAGQKPRVSRKGEI